MKIMHKLFIRITGMYVYAISTQLGVEDRTQSAVLALRRDLLEGGGME